MIRTTCAACLVLICCAGVFGCAHTPTIADEVDDAVGGPLWRDKRGLHARITVTPVGGATFAGTLLYQASSHRMVVERLMDGALEQVGYSDNRVWTRGVPLDEWQPWTQAMLFASFLPAPFDLHDPNVNVRELASMQLGDQTFRVGLINKTSEGERWAICISPSDKLPAALMPLAKRAVRKGNYLGPDAIPVTRGYAVRYEEISFVEGVALPTHWLVWNWDSRHGVTGAPIAAVVISEASFGDPDPSGFAQGQNYRDVFDSSGRWWR
ncbi:MAG TPA: hypothetical protein VGI81_11635 [Tepidisphaeraceae bacterium]